MRKRVNGYISPNTETRSSTIHGLGLFAKKNLKKGVVVAGWGGKILTKQEVQKLPKIIGNNYALEVYPGFYLAETKKSEIDASDFINHSCQPNCEIVNTIIMRTKQTIKKDEELTADFSSPHGKKTRCSCGTQGCKIFVQF